MRFWGQRDALAAFVPAKTQNRFQAAISGPTLTTDRAHNVSPAIMDPTALQHLQALAQQHALDLSNAKIRRTSSRFCLGVEHGDYNGTNLFGVGTDRYIWVAYKANGTNTIRLASGNFPDDGLIAFASGSYPTPPLTEQQSKSWARFPHGVDFVLRKEGLLQQSVGFDAVIWGNIPGGGMSRFLSRVDGVGAGRDLNAPRAGPRRSASTSSRRGST